MDLRRLRELDDFRRGSAGRLTVFLHNDHRWTVPLIAAAQREGLVPRPCDLHVFDRHHDALAPRCVTEIRRIRREDASVDALVALCERSLSRNDDDWIKAAMEIGLVRHAVVFGVEGHLPDRQELEFTDHVGERHRIIPLGLPGSALEFQGSLSDCARRKELAELLSILGWQPGEGGFSFSHGRPKAFLTVDLDCFVMVWRGYHIPWPEEVYAGEFMKTSNHAPTHAWTGKRFFQGLVDGAGVLDIAREPECCGGPEKSDRVLSDFNRYLLSGDINVSTEQPGPWVPD